MLGIEMPYLIAFIINFALLAALAAVVAGLTAFLVIRGIRTKRAQGKG